MSINHTAIIFINHTTVYAERSLESQVVSALQYLHPCEMNLLWCYFFFFFFWLRDFITKKNAMSFRIQGVLLDFRPFILSEWMCLSSSTSIILFAAHIFLKQPFIPTKE